MESHCIDIPEGLVRVESVQKTQPIKISVGQLEQLSAILSSFNTMTEQSNLQVVQEITKSFETLSKNKMISS